VGGGAWPVLRELDEVREGKFRDVGRGSVFEVILETASRDPLAAIVFEPSMSEFANERARANVLAITGVAAGNGSGEYVEPVRRDPDRPQAR